MVYLDLCFTCIREECELRCGVRYLINVRWAKVTNSKIEKIFSLLIFCLLNLSLSVMTVHVPESVLFNCNSASAIFALNFFLLTYLSLPAEFCLNTKLFLLGFSAALWSVTFRIAIAIFRLIFAIFMFSICCKRYFSLPNWAFYMIPFLAHPLESINYTYISQKTFRDCTKPYCIYFN